MFNVPPVLGVALLLLTAAGLLLLPEHPEANNKKDDTSAKLIIHFDRFPNLNTSQRSYLFICFFPLLQSIKL
jgi:hypothetical protein